MEKYSICNVNESIETMEQAAKILINAFSEVNM
jgi:hypothetical protein